MHYWGSFVAVFTAVVVTSEAASIITLGNLYESTANITVHRRTVELNSSSCFEIRHVIQSMTLRACLALLENLGLGLRLNLLVCSLESVAVFAAVVVASLFAGIVTLNDVLDTSLAEVAP